MVNGRHCHTGQKLSQEAPYAATSSVPRWALIANSSQNLQTTNVTVASDMPLPRPKAICRQRGAVP